MSLLSVKTGNEPTNGVCGLACGGVCGLACDGVCGLFGAKSGRAKALLALPLVLAMGRH